MQSKAYTFAAEPDFLLDGSPFRILSGAIHYFRVHPGYWRDRLAKLRACGFNTVETYIPWNLHEPAPGRYVFDGLADIEGFLRAAQDAGLKVILRPGPYICAEWDFGGLPGWLPLDPSMRLRCMDTRFLSAVRAWFGVLLPRLLPFLCTRGGPVIAMQVENEYGSYGNDKAYLQAVENMLRELGVDCLLFTSDGWDGPMLAGGTLPHLLKTVNFGSKADEALAALKAVQPGKPLMCMEFWCGWFDHWGEPHHTAEPEEVARELDAILSMGGSVNLYMFHGGTNFGFTSGANLGPEGEYQPTTTSYDYCAPLSEAGDPTPLYDACKRVLARHFGPPPAIAAAPTLKRAYGEVRMDAMLPLSSALESLSSPQCSAYPLSMEELGCMQGYTLYRTTLAGPIAGLPLRIPSLRDRGVVLLDGKRLGVLRREDKEDRIFLTLPEGQEAVLDILVENMGRVNYGTVRELPKGIGDKVLIGYQAHFGWTHYPLPMDSLPKRWEAQVAEGGPAFYRGVLAVDQPGDTFLHMGGFTKGVAFVNGFCLGRYWAEGPLATLYVPAPVLREGSNEVILFETDGYERPVLASVEGHVLTSRDHCE